ncbi:hypothetical protein IQE94_05565 [Synechocystis sp. PCC 7339]|uniref:hypothetical protein n=1 Tax=Synechocystis sp. PCC 7339 TaxID=2782213 RepID=UPI001CBC2FC6|nr:hypothetical protein [Synechocystis sp. PCC 7339]UAJ73750.1 hypothetical protein IQE94_05565 [Synechocystis sp. PCC 7339]
MFPSKRPGHGIANAADILGMLSSAPKGSPMEILGACIAGVEAADYFIRKMDQWEKEQRFDDNTKKLVVQATRLFESGQITKEGLKAIIDELPDTITTEAKTVEQPNGVDLNEVLKDVDPQKLAQLLKMIQ